MAKRFIDTEIWDKQWFTELHADQKLLWVYLCTNCDAAGIWDKNYKKASFELGRQVTDAALVCFGERVVHLEDNKLWLPGFVVFQYGELTETCKPHKNVIALLKRRSIDPKTLTLLKPFPKGIEREQDKDKEQEKDKEQDKEKEEDKDRPAPPVKAVKLVSLWNEITKDKLPPCTEITYLRGSLITQRLKEKPDFEHWRGTIDRMLKSPLLTGQTKSKWKANFDWLLTGDNAVKVNEGQYDGDGAELTDADRDYIFGKKGAAS